MKDVDKLISINPTLKSVNTYTYKKTVTDDSYDYDRYYESQRELTFEKGKLVCAEMNNYEITPPPKSFAWIYAKALRHSYLGDMLFNAEDDEALYNVGELTKADVEVIFDQLKVIIPRAPTATLEIISDDILPALEKQKVTIPTEIRKALKSRYQK